MGGDARHPLPSPPPSRGREFARAEGEDASRQQDSSYQQNKTKMRRNRPLAKSLRREMTEAEHKLWYFLRAKRFAAYKFKRQQPLGPYIVDFVCFNHRLILEIDGGQHAHPEDQRRDAVRTAWLESQGFTVVRFWNNQVLQETESVLKHLHHLLPPCGGAGEASPQGEAELRGGRAAQQNAGRDGGDLLTTRTYG